MITRATLLCRSARVYVGGFRRGHGTRTARARSLGLNPLCRGVSAEGISGRVRDVGSMNLGVERLLFLRTFANEGGGKHSEESRDLYEHEMLQRFIEHHSADSQDTTARRDRIISLSRYLHKELGIEVEEVWNVLCGSSAGKVLVTSYLGTIRDNVMYFKKEAGWTNEQILELLEHPQAVFLLKIKAGELARKMKVFENAFGLPRREIVDWVSKRPAVMHAGDLEEKLEYVIGRMGLSTETLLTSTYASTLLSYSLDRCIKPRFEFLCKMEERHGRLLRAQPQTYMRYSSSKFKEVLKVEYGEGTTQEYEDFLAKKEAKVRPQISDIHLSDFERVMIEKYMVKHHSAATDNIGRRERVLFLSRYLQKLGAGVEESWEVLTRNVEGRKLAESSFETIQGTVEFFKREGGWSESDVLEVFRRHPNTFKMRLDTTARKMKILEKVLGLSQKETFDWVLKRPVVLHAGDLEEKLEYALGAMGLSKDTLMKDEVFLTLRLEGRIKPRMEYLRLMQERYGWCVAVQPQTLLRYSSAMFEKLLATEYGVRSVEEYYEFYKNHAENYRGSRVDIGR